MEKVDIPLLEVKPSNNNNKADEVSRRGMTGVYEAVAGVLGDTLHDIAKLNLARFTNHIMHASANFSPHFKLPICGTGHSKNPFQCLDSCLS